MLGLTRGSLGSLRLSGHRRTECENWILGRADKLVSLKPKLVCGRFSNSFVLENKIEKEGLPRDSPAGLGAGGSSSKVL